MKEQELSLPELFIDTQRLLHRYHMIQHHKEENGFDPRQVQGGYITREPAPKDKRAMIVSLTEKGKAMEFKELDFQEVFSCLDETA